LRTFIDFVNRSYILYDFVAMVTQCENEAGLYVM